MYLLENRKTKDKHECTHMFTKGVLCDSKSYFHYYTFTKNGCTYSIVFKNDEKIDLSCQFNLINDNYL